MSATLKSAQIVKTIYQNIGNFFPIFYLAGCLIPILYC
jgi:hypothetical protein